MATPPAKRRPVAPPRRAATNDGPFEGQIERIVFRNEENGFAVARVRLGRSRHSRVITISGALPGVAVGELVTLEGGWVEDRRYGATFQVRNYQPHAPTDPDGIVRYLGSGLLRGIGPATAERIVAVFGARTLEILEQAPELLTNVRGVSKRRAAEIGAAWAAQRETRDLALFLQQHAVSPALAYRIAARYGSEALATVQRQPYALAFDVEGIGFRTADEIARKLGLPEQSPERTHAALCHVLSRATDDGHCYLPRAELVPRTAELLDLALERIEEDLEGARRERRVVLDGDDLYLPSLHQCEAGFAHRLQLLKGTSRPTAAGEADLTILQTAAAATGVLLSEEQRAAVVQALHQPVCVLTGGPGSGKTTALRALIAVLERRGVRYCLAAPTGRAARRLADATERPASTLHRLLEYAPGTREFRATPERPLPYEFVIIDESSMLDIVLAYHLGQALAPSAQLLLVGDVDQLPSVGPGNVLRDLIESKTVETVRLTTLFRQARDSDIIVNAHRIRDGELPSARDDSDDFFLIEERRPAAVVEKVVRLVQERIPRKYGLDPLADVQVLCPTNRGVAGVVALNGALQAALNGNRLAHSVAWGSQRFALGDKVMQTRNNYDLNVFNGDVGQVAGLDLDEQTLHVEFGTPSNPALTTYALRDLDELQLAYAATVHKAQGSEYPCVVLLLLPEHGPLLRRDLLYTAVTRAKRLCLIVGSTVALRRAVAVSDPEARNTRLRARLQEWPADGEHAQGRRSRD